jgi:hypothetical protein
MSEAPNIDRLLAEWSTAASMTPLQASAVRQAVLRSKPEELSYEWWRKLFSGSQATMLEMRPIVHRAKWTWPDAGFGRVVGEA